MELGAGEIIVILVIVLLLFGPTKLPQLGESLGRGIRSFKKAMSADEPASSREAGGRDVSDLPAAPPTTTPAPEGHSVTSRAERK